MMKKFLVLSLALTLLFTTAKADNWDNFYSYLAQKIKYPTGAQLENHQGNSIITLTIVQGILKNVNVQTELGKGCDVAILNSLMAYPQLKTIKKGNYALKVAFRLQAANGSILNEFAKKPFGFTATNMLHIIETVPLNAQTTSNGPKVGKPKHISFSSKTETNSPLFVVDGAILEDDKLPEINSNKIESVTILKDASAIASYGSEAINGVIIIKTKKQEPQKTKK